ncbi:MAG: peptide-methionine (S)-S-oxide reductase MsrA [Candidatus Neomarinimicrobiota bacterium]|nr:peptide-methionine (S)-S-oxide reductase MsrA [Candidatus Neomarinimicrobiota bacterium]
MKKNIILILSLFLSILYGEKSMKEMQKATFGAGCFWCVEAVFERLEGVVDVIPGYSGGHKNNPTYKEICTGMTGHAEVAQITFDPKIITFDDLLNMFWKSHDPTTRNRQGNDIGTQYRSAIFYHNNEQKTIAEKSKNKVDNSNIFSNPIVTEITKLEKFWVAEDYHNNYYNNNMNQPYCKFIIKPKLDKLFK